jgi:hypothetical protein
MRKPITTDDGATATLHAIMLLTEARNIGVFDGMSSLDYVFLSGAIVRLQNDLAAWNRAQSLEVV